MQRCFACGTPDGVLVQCMGCRVGVTYCGLECQTHAWISLGHWQICSRLGDSKPLIMMLLGQHVKTFLETPDDREAFEQFDVWAERPSRYPALGSTVSLAMRLRDLFKRTTRQMNPTKLPEEHFMEHPDERPLHDNLGKQLWRNMTDAERARFYSNRKRTRPDAAASSFTSTHKRQRQERIARYLAQDNEWNTLPLEIQLAIIIFLPARDVINFAGNVSKAQSERILPLAWRLLIERDIYWPLEAFITTHSNKWPRDIVTSMCRVIQTAIRSDQDAATLKNVYFHAFEDMIAPLMIQEFVSMRNSVYYNLDANDDPRFAILFSNTIPDIELLIDEWGEAEAFHLPLNPSSPPALHAWWTANERVFLELVTERTKRRSRFAATKALAELLIRFDSNAKIGLRDRYVLYGMVGIPTELALVTDMTDV